MIALGTGLLWFGWYGFNAGSALRVDAVTASTFLNTDLAASFAAIVWLLIEWANGRQPKFVRLLTGAVAGLATIFASKLWNVNGADALLAGNPTFLVKQLVAAIACSAWAFVFTYCALWIINRMTPAKVDPRAEETGLDIELHGEEAYPSGL